MPGKNGMNNGNGNGRFDFSSNGNGNGNHNSDKPFNDDDFEEDEEHEHVYTSITQTRNLSAYAEALHQVITLEFQDRGLSLDFSYAEAQELAQVMAEIAAFLSSHPTS